MPSRTVSIELTGTNAKAIAAIEGVCGADSRPPAGVSGERSRYGPTTDDATWYMSG